MVGETGRQWEAMKAIAGIAAEKTNGYGKTKNIFTAEARRTAEN